MKKSRSISSEAWPELPYEKFASTAHLLHMGLQVIGKLKLLTPFEPEWANVALWVTSKGLTTGPIPYKSGTFDIHIDLINHKITCATSNGNVAEIKLTSMSVAQFTQTLLDALNKLGVKVKINFKPQEISNPIPFDQDTEQRIYDKNLANAWWRILLNSYQVMQRYHGQFKGKTPPIGFMWGTFDLRDARYKVGESVPPTGPNREYIRRNAMDEAQIEAGWWSGNPAYPRPAYYSFTFPEPKGIAEAKIKPATAHWEKSLGLFVLDYDDVRKADNPEKTLLDFLESTYQAGADLASWDKNLIGPGKPV